MPSCRSPSACSRAAAPASSEQVDGALLEHAGADAAKHMLAAGALQDDVVHADAGQQLPEQQSGRSRADDDDLGAHQVPKCSI